MLTTRGRCGGLKKKPRVKMWPHEEKEAVLAAEREKLREQGDALKVQAQRNREADEHKQAG